MRFCVCVRKATKSPPMARQHPDKNLLSTRSRRTSPPSKIVAYFSTKKENTLTQITARFLYRAGAETPPKLLRKIPSFSQNEFFLENVSAVDTQTAVLVSTTEVWISAPDTQTPISLGFLGIHS